MDGSIRRECILRVDNSNFMEMLSMAKKCVINANLNELQITSITGESHTVITVFRGIIIMIQLALCVLWTLVLLSGCFRGVL